MKKNNAQLGHQQGDIKSNTNSHTLVQRFEILAQLQCNASINTFEFREAGYFAPAPRIKELRDLGYTIHTVFETIVDNAGVKHIGVGRYVYKGYKVGTEAERREKNKETAA